MLIAALFIIAKREKQPKCPKGQILYDTTYMKCLKYSYSQRQKVEWWLSGAEGGRNGELMLDGYRVSVWDN